MLRCLWTHRRHSVALSDGNRRPPIFPSRCLLQTKSPPLQVLLRAKAARVRSLLTAVSGAGRAESGVERRIQKREVVESSGRSRLVRLMWKEQRLWAGMGMLAHDERSRKTWTSAKAYMASRAGQETHQTWALAGSER